jgi:predicted small lipoprotein YifL
MRSLTIVLTLLVAIALSTSACGGKKYLPPPEERPGEMEPYNPDVQETDERGPYNVDVPVQ